MISDSVTVDYNWTVPCYIWWK